MNNLIKTNVFEMFSDRNYKYDTIDLTLDLFTIYNENNVKSIVKFVLDDNKLSQFKEIINTLLLDIDDIININKIFIITFNNLNYKREEIEIMNAKNFKVNITKHIMALKHELLSSDELIKLKEKIDIKTLPLIYTSDPMIKWYGWTSGNICKISRPTSTYYRLIKCI